ncbi:MAG TPA: C40 family peptidase [Pyrinomonadaceae bacterium]|jgi:peptidoglycan endopeptidase LytE|nr:C40 family peptidase [Pyrinomonadaceae bacterium]
MSLSKLFPRLLAACAALGLAAIAANAQTAATTRPRQTGTLSTTTTQQSGALPRLENDVFVVSESDAAEEAGSAVKAPPATAARLGSAERVMLSAIEERLGVPYRMGATGPYRFDCSGFVWSVFQQAGVGFERSTARTLWSKFQPVDGEDRYKFGTLVFFNNLHHVGIVADSEGFYHASTSQGVVYSRFSDYWLRRLDGFRRVPVEEMNSLAVASASGR